MASQQVLTALEELHQELDKLAPAIKHVEMALQVTKSLQAIPVKHQELLEAIKKEDTAFKKELTETSSRSLVLMKEENSQLNKTTAEIQQQVKYEQKYLAELREKVKNYYELIERVSFPDRLDKLDNNVSAIMLAIQSVQNRLENLERNLVDRIKEGFEQQKQAQADFQRRLTRGIKQQQVTTYVTWGIILAAALAIIMMLKR